MKRLKKILKWTGVALGVLVAILLVGNAWFVWTTGTRLERQLAAIRQAGDPLSIAELAPKPIPPEKNAATFLRRAEADVTAIEKETFNVRDLSEYPGYRMPPEDLERIKAALAAHPNVIPLLEQAAACPDYDAQLDYGLSAGEFMAQLLGVVQKPRGAARVLRKQAILLVAEGNRDEAVRMAIVMFRLARRSARNPSLIGFFASLAIRGSAINSANLTLQAGPVSKEVRGALDAELALHERTDEYVSALKSERAFGLDSFRTFPLRNFWLVQTGWWNKEESDYLDAMQVFLAVAIKPGSYRQDVQAMQRIPGGLGVFARLVVPAMQATHGAVVRTRAMVRSLRVLNALQAHVEPGSNEVPKLSELGLPIEATTDPFTGEPLHVKRLPQGWLVYSVGRDYQDDGGKLEDDSDVGVGPPPPTAKPSEN